MSVEFLSAILGPEMGASILWTPGKKTSVLQEKPMSIKFLVLGAGGGIFWFWGGGSADFIFMGVRIFLINSKCKNWLGPVWKGFWRGTRERFSYESLTYLRGEKAACKTPFFTNKNFKGPCCKRTLNWTGSIFLLLIVPSARKWLQIKSGDFVSLSLS